jgi:hypothetical protein
MIYACECNGNNGCNLHFEDECWEEARHSMTADERDYLSILHPDCKNLLDYDVVKKSDKYIIVKYVEE